MDIALAKLINQIINKPELIAHSSGNIDSILTNGGVAATHENKTALSSVLGMLRKPGSGSVLGMLRKPGSGIVLSDEFVGWDGGGIIAPMVLEPRS